MTNFALEEASTTEVVAAFTAPQEVIPAVGSGETNGWYAVGAFSPHISVTNVRLEGYGWVSTSGMTLQIRLWDTQALVALASVVSIVSTSLVSRKGIATNLIGGRTYQIQARALSANVSPVESEFGTMASATITD